MEKLRTRLGSKKTFLLGVTLGAAVSMIAIGLNYAPRILFICLAILLKFFDGIREPQFEVVAFIYFAQNILPTTTAEMQG